MSADQWDRFLDGRRSGNGRTLVEIDTTDDVVKAINPRKKLDFLRYHTSLQAFFDAGVRADVAASRLTESPCRSTRTVAATAAA